MIFGYEPYPGLHAHVTSMIEAETEDGGTRRKKYWLSIILLSYRSQVKTNVLLTRLEYYELVETLIFNPLAIDRIVIILYPTTCPSTNLNL